MASYSDSSQAIDLKISLLKGGFLHILIIRVNLEINQPSYRIMLSISTSRLKTKLIFVHVNIGTNWNERIGTLIQTCLSVPKTHAKGTPGNTIFSPRYVIIYVKIYITFHIWIHMCIYCISW